MRTHPIERSPFWVTVVAITTSASLLGSCGSSTPEASLATATTLTTRAQRSGTQPATSDSGQTSNAPAIATPTSPVTVPVTLPVTLPATTAAATTSAATVPSTLAVPTASGWAIDDTTTSQQGSITHYNAVSCDSEFGPWHVVASFTVADNISHNVFYDALVAADGTGTMAGEEHSTWEGGLKVDGTYAGTASIKPGGAASAFVLGLDISVSLVIDDPKDLRGVHTETSHLSKSLQVIPASGGQCP